jgi:hypothetical protein
MQPSLKISTDLSLPSEAVTQTFAILAKRGMGKTYTASVMVEEMLKQNLPVVVADPVGVWWGLRASASGKGPGYPIVVFGGEHADIPLDKESGEAIADVLIEQRFPAILDLSGLRKGEQTRFMETFCERLYFKNRNALHLVLDEADAFAPQKPLPGQQRMLGAVDDLVRRGRARGLGITLVTQRAAVLNKDVLTQVEVLVALRTIAPQDRAAVDSWVNAHGTEEQRKEMMKSLPSLPIGTAWFWSPGWLDLFKRVKIRRRETFDSSATPSAGAKSQRPSNLALVDLESLKERFAATLQKRREEDPRILKAEIARLQSELAVKKPEVKIEHVPVISQEDQAYLTGLKKDAEAALTALVRAVEAIGARTAVPAGPVAKPVARPAIISRPVSHHDDGQKLAGAERKILTVLAQYPTGRSKVQIAVIAGYAVGGGGFNNALSSLRSKGFIETAGETSRITQGGADALGSFTPLPVGPALLAYWQQHLGKAERAILGAFDGQRFGLSKVELAARAGYEVTGGGFNNALGKLRTLELITRGEPIWLSEELI